MAPKFSSSLSICPLRALYETRAEDES
jgi:hypothetical protein